MGKRIQVQLTQQAYSSTKSYIDARLINNTIPKFIEVFGELTVYANQNGHSEKNYLLNNVILWAVILLQPVPKIFHR